MINFQKIINTASSLVLETAQSKYNAQWSKISSLQSSASSLGAILGVVFTFLSGINSENIIKLYFHYSLKDVFSFYLYAFSILFLVSISAFYLYQVIKQKSVDDLEFPLEIYKDILGKIDKNIHNMSTDEEILRKTIYELISVNDLSIRSLQNTINLNQNNYDLGLKYSIFSLVAIIIFTFLINGIPIEKIPNLNLVFSLITAINGLIIFLTIALKSENHQ